MIQSGNRWFSVGKSWYKMNQNGSEWVRLEIGGSVRVRAGIKGSERIRVSVDRIKIWARISNSE